MAKWIVKYRRAVIAADPEDSVRWGWEIAGETVAPSEKKAINNVRYRVFGKQSQYRPVEADEHDRWARYVEWKAEQT